MYSDNVCLQNWEISLWCSSRRSLACPRAALRTAGTMTSSASSPIRSIHTTLTTRWKNVTWRMTWLKEWRGCWFNLRFPDTGAVIEPCNYNLSGGRSKGIGENRYELGRSFKESQVDPSIGELLINLGVSSHNNHEARMKKLAPILPRHLPHPTKAAAGHHISGTCPKSRVSSCQSEMGVDCQ